MKSGFGCHIGHICAAALAYADDLVLLAPTATTMRRLLLICEEYARDFCISFNVTKTKCLVVLLSRRRVLAGYPEDCIICIDNQPIERVSAFSHLGHLITSEMLDDGDIVKRCYDFTGQVNNIICYFRKQNSFVLYKLFRAYCSRWYGCELWSFNNGKIDDAATTWRKSIRRIWKLPWRTHHMHAR